MVKRAGFSIIGVFLLLASATAARQRDYFTEGEVDEVRAARGNEVLGGVTELQYRVPAYLRIADNRLVALSLKEKETQVTAADKATRKPPAAPVSADVYLKDFTRSELLRGYIQALDEVLDHIDDVYNRKGDVREALESLERYTREQLPLLRKFQPKNGAESTALADAIETTERVLRDSRSILDVMPKTERPAGRKP